VRAAEAADESADRGEGPEGLDGLDGLVDAATTARLARVRAGEDPARRLRVAALEPGQAGVLDVQVRAVGPSRTYERRRGGQGLVQRVTLADGTGEVDLVLWDDERRQCQDGPFQPGAFLRLRGAAVKAGHRGGVELGLGSALVEALPMPAPSASSAGVLEGRLLDLGEVRPVGSPPAMRFTMEATLETSMGPVRLAAWDLAVKALRAAGAGGRVRISGAAPNPLLDGWWTVPADAAVERLP
jgi:hypothetical protein